MLANMDRFVISPSSSDSSGHQMLPEYSYQDLDRRKSTFRLIKVLGMRTIGEESLLECTMSHFSILSAPKYNALSYEWRIGRNSATNVIVVDGALLRIGSNLHDYLLRMTSSGALFDHRLRQAWLWVDQICIQQSKLDEKTFQVGLMANIYRHANIVIIWLGSDFAGSTAWERNQRTLNSPRPTRQEDKYARCRASSYWTRLWIIQEIVLARDLFLFLDNELHPWWMLVQSERDACQKSLLDSRQSHILDLDQLRNARIGRRTYETSWSGVIALMRTAECEDVRDKAYGLLGLVDSRVAITANYTLHSDEVIDRVIRQEYGVHFAHDFEARDSHAPLKDESFIAFINDLLFAFYGPGSGLEGQVPENLRYVKDFV